MPDCPFFGHLLFVFSEGSNSDRLSGRLANIIMISEEQWENDEISFQNVYDHMELVNGRKQA